MALIKYVNNANPFDFVNIFEDDSFVIVGETDVSESDLLKMVDWEDVSGWTLTDI
tara:strand:+ start:166 stop:330 length:165 start_codon:yes stop_codon:yes gene_type:complete